LFFDDRKQNCPILPTDSLNPAFLQQQWFIFYFLFCRCYCCLYLSFIYISLFFLQYISFYLQCHLFMM
jgi:hypothetical protein